MLYNKTVIRCHTGTMCLLPQASSLKDHVEVVKACQSPYNGMEHLELYQRPNFFLEYFLIIVCYSH